MEFESVKRRRSNSQIRGLLKIFRIRTGSQIKDRTLQNLEGIGNLVGRGISRFASAQALVVGVVAVVARVARVAVAVVALVAAVAAAVAAVAVVVASTS